MGHLIPPKGGETHMYTLLAAITGGFVALMIQLNGDLQLREGALPALMAIHLSGVVAAFAYLAATWRGGGKNNTTTSPPRGAASGTAPLWFVSAGAFGAVVVFLSSEVYARGGVLLTLSGTLAGTTLLAHLLEGTRWFDGRRSPALQRLLSLAL
ncbi:MAG TPA: DMT family transporter, partial [Spirochaetia bacterium]|nr:DMT family transporter [Spirochaetia bacterium]